MAHVGSNHVKREMTAYGLLATAYVDDRLRITRSGPARVRDSTDGGALGVAYPRLMVIADARGG